MGNLFRTFKDKGERHDSHGGVLASIERIGGRVYNRRQPRLERMLDLIRWICR